MAHERLRPQYHFDEEKIQLLKQLAPECFEDGKVNFETLRQNLADWTQDEDDTNLEHFGLFWPGKKDSRRAAALPPEGTLEPIYGEGLKSDGEPDDDGFNDSKNIFIEGENLEVLKILQKSYANKIKMIYIDPPYNTGNDFIYDDNFTEPLLEYRRRTGQVDEEGKTLTTNRRSDGRYHSKWLSMMYPRLRLARNLLHEDGVIFISIDDNEVHNLRAIMNEIFGEENFIGEFIWKSRQNKDNRNVTGLSIDHEYVLSFSKSSNGRKLKGTERRIEQYKNPDKDSRGPWVSGNMVGLLPEDQRPNCHYDLIHPTSKINYGKPKMGWRYDKNTMNRLIEENRILWPNSQEGRPRRKVFLRDVDSELPNFTSIIGEKIYTRNGTSELDEIFGEKYFDFPKPSKLIQELIEQVCNEEEDIILDFFSGSGTTGQAVLDLNEKDNIQRRFILVQLPELLDKNSSAYKAGFKSISDISIERLRRVSSKKENQKGIRFYSLATSCYKKWPNYQGNDVSDLERNLDLFNQSPLQENTNKPKLLNEILLLEGFPLDSSISKILHGQNEVYHVKAGDLVQELFVCMDDKIEENIINEMVMSDHDTFICLDSSISNVNKLRLSDKGLIKTI